MTLDALQFLILSVSGWITRRQQHAIDYMKEENRLLKERLAGKRIRFTDRERRRLAMKAKVLDRKTLNGVACIVTPDTLLRWYRQLVAQKYDSSQRKGPGRPRIKEVIQNLVIRMALENETWGYTRIKGALKNLGYEVGRTTIKRILAENVIDPAPIRGKHMPWSKFLKAHWGVISAADFFNVEALTLCGLVRYYVLFVIDLKTRWVDIVGIVHQPNGDWMKQIAKQITDPIDGILLNTKYLIHDRDPLFTGEFQAILKSSGIKTVKLPTKSPDLNAYAERFVLSIKSESLSRVIPLGENHLRQIVFSYVDHYHQERNHQGLKNKLITTKKSVFDPKSKIKRHSRLGGLLNFYYRDAA